MPAPSYVIASGRGLAAVWLVEVLARDALPRWQALASRLIEHFSALGIDPGASRDVARVLRLAGTMNTTPVPARLVRCVYPEVGAPAVYGFDELCKLLLPYARPKRRRRPSAARLVRLGGRESKLWADRLADLDRLLELRWFGALPPRERDYWMLLGACALSWMIPPGVARREARMLAIRAIGGDWGEREVDARLGEVLGRAESAGRGEVVTWQGVEVDPRYRYRTSTIIELLQITAGEQRGMKTLIGPAEAARRYQGYRHHSCRNAR